MDELELLKRDWKREDNSYPSLSYDDIYEMIHKKSSSIVKWIFIISLLEFGFWLFVSFAIKAFGIESSDGVKAMESSTTFIILTILGHIILVYFFYLFYKNYRNISSTDNIRVLMKTILKTRKTVKQYVFVNLAYLVIGTIFGIFYFSNNDAQTRSLIENATADGNLFKLYAGIAITTILFLAITIGFLLVFYWLIYGILLKRLNKNYEDLKKLEV